MAESLEQITLLLKAWQDGDTQAESQLFAVIYNDLRRIAENRLSREGREHTLQATELVHEIFPQLARQRQTWQNRSHFFAIASECMRRFLVDYARTSKRQKRGGGAFRVSLEDLNETEICRIEDFDEILAVDEALDKLREISPLQSDIIKHRYFGGLDREEIADLTRVSPATIDRNYRFAKAWLKCELVLKFSPLMVKTSDIREPRNFVDLFRNDSVNVFALHIREVLPASLRQAIDELKAISRVPGNVLSDLIGCLNRLQMAREVIFPPHLVSRLPNDDIKAEATTAEANLRVNRRLLYRAFPDEFRNLEGLP